MVKVKIFIVANENSTRSFSGYSETFMEQFVKTVNRLVLTLRTIISIQYISFEIS